MGRIKNHEGLRLIVIAAAIIVVSNIAVIETTQITSAHVDRLIPFAMRACIIYQTYPATAHCSMIVGSSTSKAV